MALLLCHAEICGKEMKLAKRTIPGLHDGTGSEHRQQCPVCRGNDSFWFSDNSTPYRKRINTFHCDVCGFGGDLYKLVGKVRLGKDVLSKWNDYGNWVDNGFWEAYAIVREAQSVRKRKR